MVEYSIQLDGVFGSLADPTRRDILHRLQAGGMNVGDIAAPYDISLAAISKHLKILERAKLIRKRRRGQQRYVTLAPETMKQAADYMQQYERLWTDRFDRLEQYLKEDE